MLSSLEIAQEATLRPIADVADEAGIEPDELELYGRYKAKVDLSILERLADRPDGKIVNVTAITPTPAGEGKTTTSVALTQGLGQIGRKPGARAARGVARAGVRDQGRRGRRRLHAGRPDGGPEPPLHGRPARDHRRQQPALGADRRAPAARQRATHRPAHDLLAPVHGHERPLAARHRHVARRPRERLPAADGLRHHRGERDHGARRRRPRPRRPPRPPRPDHDRPDLRGRAGDGRAAEGRRLDGRPPQGRDQAEPRPDARGAAGVHPLRPVREHRARQQLARRRPGRRSSWAST